MTRAEATMALDASSHFGPFDRRVWLNCAHQGPLPRVAADAAREAVARKVAPHRIVFASHPDPTRNPELHHALAEAGIDVSLRRGELRFRAPPPQHRGGRRPRARGARRGGAAAHRSDHERWTGRS